jgi:molecular chaperone GrpE
MSEKKVKKDTKETKEKNGKRGADVSGGKAPEGHDIPGEQPSGAASAEKAPDGQGEDGDARYMRLAADFQNYKKRTEKEKSDIYAYANEKFAADLLDVIDNFERATLQDAASGADGKFIEGMKLIMDQLISVLERNDVSEIDALGADFDPNLHHAVPMEEPGEYESGKVTKVLQKGYMIRDKVLRPATVIVAR